MFLEVKNLNKKFNKEHVVEALSFELSRQKTLSILGKSGCGKTTMLKMVSGLVKPDSGSVFLDGNEITDLKAEKRNMVYLYQEDLLFPHLTIFENIAFGLRLKKHLEADIQMKVKQMAQSLELQDQLKKMPHQLSGGQRQRVSFGRAIIINPSVLLLDEPFGSLDSGTRTRMQALFKNLTEEYNITSLFITHDLKEAILMGDKIGFMQNGNLNVYPSKKAFLNDPTTGVHNEINFWNSLQLDAVSELKNN
ncbi:ABC transporter ATP-binding protein [Leeuwenhoekiella sp. NPDC079379]|uniref:ABC transporter ATP-binding protein n=1 Tax=Leeuwenhoekiella sp. NPDC079379 TaxID=3364122 RepID=UPI0037C7C2F8